MSYKCSLMLHVSGESLEASFPRKLEMFLFFGTRDRLEKSHIALPQT